MKADPLALAVRLDAALFLFATTVAALFLIGAAQSFSDNTLRVLFVTLRWLSWLGLLVTWLGLLPWCLRRGGRLASLVAVGIGFGLLFALVLLWGAWVYPDLGRTPW